MDLSCLRAVTALMVLVMRAQTGDVQAQAEVERVAEMLGA